MQKPNISFLNKCTTFQFIEEGFSDDEKWCVDHTYLLRLSPHEDVDKLKKQAEMVNEVHSLDKHIPYVHEVGMVDDRAYMILNYVSGKNGEVALPLKSEKDQYVIGSQVGKTLKRLHTVQAPAEHPKWEEIWRNRVERQAPRFMEIVNNNVHYECILPFIQYLTPAKRGFTTLRKYKYKKPNFSLITPEKLGFSYFRKAPDS